MKPVDIEGFVAGKGRPLAIIAGPCVLEDPDEMLRTAERLARVCGDLGVGYCFKSSYLKDNRTSGASYRGPGLTAGLDLLARVRSEAGVPVLTDVHGADECAAVAGVVDVLQIPAFLCRQSSLLEAAGRSGRVVNVKKGQMVAAADMAHAVAKVRDAGGEQILLTERGSFFGYRDLVVDYRSIKVMRDLGVPVVFDATHSVQTPGSTGTATGGKPELIPLLARCGVVAGADAVFLEVHPEPARALCDAGSQLPLERFEPLVRGLAHLRTLANEEAWA
ncbi:3-deoxy-8-phosphooctulonate synthase [bacterium]|nr:3-deoxy-8-phosphooctulonate synthase [bacterium]